MPFVWLLRSMLALRLSSAEKLFSNTFSPKMLNTETITSERTPSISMFNMPLVGLGWMFMFAALFGGQQGPQDNQGPKNDDNVTDVDFEEVK